MKIFEYSVRVHHFSASRLEAALNEWGAEGWVVASIYMPVGANYYEIILMREKSQANQA